MKVTWCWWLVSVLLLASVSSTSAADKKKAGNGATAGNGDEEKVEAVIEDVNAKQLERLLEEKDYVAVYWCKF